MVAGICGALTMGRPCIFLAQGTHFAVTMLSVGTVSTPILCPSYNKEAEGQKGTCSKLNCGAQINHSALLPPGEALQRHPPTPGCPLSPSGTAYTDLGAPHLQDFALGTLRKQQHLVIQRVQRLASNFGLLLGNADAVLQQVGLDVGR